MITPKINVKMDTKGMQAILKRLGYSENAAVTVGVHEDAGQYKNGQSVAMVALANEFGVPSKNIPERSFLRSAIHGNMDKINAWRQEAVRNMLENGWSMEKALTMIGFRVQTLIQNKIKSNIQPPNATRTLAAKKKKGVAPRTLIDSTLLLRSISYKILLHDSGDGT